MNFLVLVNGAPKYKYFYAEIAKHLAERGHNIYFAVNAETSAIAEPIADIDNSENTFFFDNYLKENFKFLSKKPIKLEETWGDVFHSDFDRFFCHNYNLRENNDYWTAVLNGLQGFFEFVISNNSIDVILYENVSNSFAYMAYKVGVSLGCTYIGLIGSRLPNRYEIQTSITSESDFITSDIDVTDVTVDEENWSNSYLKELFYIQPDYMKDSAINKKIKLSSLFSYKKFLTAQKILKVIKKADSYYNYQVGSSFEQLTSMYKLNWRKMLNENQSNKYYMSMEEVDVLLENSKEAFYIYPTHYHPESSTSVLAPDYTNELNNIINIHNNLPVGRYLYVKDHISARGVQNKQFYEKVSALPGVRLIHFDYNVKKLIKYSRGVITVTSTVGYEAALMNKPVYLLGNVFYENFPNIFKINSFIELREMFYKEPIFYSNQDITKFIVAYYRYTFEGQLLIGKPELWNPGYFSKIVDDIFYRIDQVKKRGLL